MSENLAAVTTPAKRETAADARIMAQIEKWMAVIREIKQEQAKN